MDAVTISLIIPVALNLHPPYHPSHPPELPHGLIDQVDVVNAGLELLGAEDFDLTRVRNLRLMSNNIRRIGSKTLR